MICVDVCALSIYLAKLILFKNELRAYESNTADNKIMTKILVSSFSFKGKLSGAKLSICNWYADSKFKQGSKLNII